jgi:transcriptional regulator with XRE-family HTH domain
MSPIQRYTEGNFVSPQETQMPKTKKDALANFGARLADFRKAAGYTQAALADEVGVSRRMITYYESETAHPPANLLPDLARALGITTDELLSVKQLKRETNVGNSRLQRRLKQIERMGARERRQLLQIIDAFIDRERFKEKSRTTPKARSSESSRSRL